MKRILATFFVIALLVGCNTKPGPDTLPQASSSVNTEPGPSTQKGTGGELVNSTKSPPRIEQRGENPNSPQIALVIGNGQYDYSPLNNPEHDAKAMTDRLIEMGFSVTQAINLDHLKMEEVVQAFGENLSESPKEVALFYFSGHGAQVKGKNYLLPVNNNKIQEEQDLEPHAIVAQNISAMMQEVNKGMNILILDACRNNPYKGQAKSAHQGLAKMVPPRGALIAFATAPDKTASDGDGSYGLYTSHLLKALETAKHRRIEDVFMEVRNPVLEESGEQQEPWYQASLREPFCFGGCP